MFPTSFRKVQGGNKEKWKQDAVLNQNMFWCELASLKLATDTSTNLNTLFTSPIYIYNSQFLALEFDQAVFQQYGDTVKQNWDFASLSEVAG